MRTVGLHLPDSSSIFANMGFKGNSAILMPSGSVRRQSLSSPAVRTATKSRRHVPWCWKMYSCWENKRWCMLNKGIQPQPDPECCYNKRRKGFLSALECSILKNWYFWWPPCEDLIIRRWPHSLLLLSPSPETALSKGPTTRQCQTQRALSVGSPAAFDSADHSSLETLFTSFHDPPLPCFSATSPALLSASPLDLFPWPISERPQMSQASQKFVSNYKADDYESKHTPGSLFGANTRAVYPIASWAVCWTGLTPSIPHIPPCLFTNSQFSGSGFPR